MQCRITGYYPGALGKITEVHAVYYWTHWGFDKSFEIQVSTELAGFLYGFRKHRDGLWINHRNDFFAGSIAVDAGKTGNSARLRWFIVDTAFQGAGVGRDLLDRALHHCKDRGYDSVYLWTFRGLEAARHLYESAGFTLKEEYSVQRWGTRIQEQRYQLSAEVL